MEDKRYAINREARRRLEEMDIPFNSESFFRCVEEDHVIAVKSFLDAGMDPNAKNVFDATALMIAANQGLMEITQILLENGAGVNIKSDDGVTALMAAAYRGHEDIVRILLEHGAGVNITSESGLTALMAAEKISHAGIVQLLKDAGAEGGCKHYG